MPRVDLKAFFDSLVVAQRPEQVASLLSDIGDSTEHGLDEELGDSGLLWHAVGNDAGNLSAINLATKPGRSLTERITNGIDAMLELRARLITGDLPKNPRQAASAWFGRPVSGPDQGLYTWDYSEHDDDRAIHVALLESGREDAPTVDVLDAGTGIRNADFTNTILSLRSGNKISKFYLIGAFGQGGSSTLAFSDYAIYASRHVDAPNVVSFTVVRVLRLSAAYKEDCFAFLAVRSPDGGVSVPQFTIDDPSMELYQGVPRAPVWNHGTWIRHVGYKLEGLTGGLQAVPGNLYHFLHAAMFDPLLPFRVLDLRRPGKEKNELVAGSRNRLMKYTTKSAEELEDSSGELRHYRPMEFVVPHGETDPTIGIEYWVVLNWRKAPKGGGGGRMLRPSSNELFVQKGHPVVGSLNGQNQGELPASLFRKLNLGMVSRHIVVHVDASRVPSHIRRMLFSSTREGFKDGPVLSAIQRVLTTMLSEDEELGKLERELAERIVQKENQKTEDEVKKQITKLLLDSGVKVQDEGPASKPGVKEESPVTKTKRASFKKREPLPTLPYPQVTKWEIAYPAAGLDVHIGDYETVLVETDADAEFDRRGAVGIRAEPPLLEVGSKAPLSGGRVRWRLRAVADVREGQTGNVIATITRPDGSQLASEREFRILAKRPEPAKPARGLVPPFEVLPVDPTKDEDKETWGRLWPALLDETDPSKLASVAYKVEPAAGKRIVYFNTLFGPFRNAEDAYLAKSPTLAELFRVQYKVWIGYHALLQEADSADELSESETERHLVERVLEEETVRVATMQVKQASQIVELKRIVVKAEEEASIA
jgi:hypothetical protein